MISIVPIESISKKIMLIRGHKVMLDADLGKLYGVETKVLNQAVKRNIDRFPNDFMFQLNNSEFSDLKSQFVTSSSKDWGGKRKLPFVFTEQGVAMLSSVLKSDRAIKVNITIIRAFVKLREIIASHKDLADRFDELEKKYDKQFVLVFKILRQMAIPLDSGQKANKKIGFIAKTNPAKLD